MIDFMAEINNFCEKNKGLRKINTRRNRDNVQQNRESDQKNCKKGHIGGDLPGYGAADIAAKLQF